MDKPMAGTFNNNNNNNTFYLKALFWVLKDTLDSVEKEKSQNQQEQYQINALKNTLD